MSPEIISTIALCLALLAFGRAMVDNLIYRKRIRELHRKTLETQRNLRRLGDLANEVAHEIKNPITAILCSAETLDLLIGDDLDEVHRKSLRYIKEYGDNLLRLVSDFLDVSRAETGKIECRPKATKIAPTVESVVGLLESNALSKKITVKHAIMDPEIEGFVDPKHFTQVLFNLVHNAIKFTEHGGEVRVLVKSDFPNPLIRIAVKDNGVGIPEGEVDQLFNAYAQYEGHGGYDTGVGIGLSLCKTLIEMNGGGIAVTSQQGVGSSFEFTVPLHEEGVVRYQQIKSATYPAVQAATADKPLHGQSFLVVDEDLGSRESIARLIEAWGGMVDKVAMAVDAIEKIENNDYDAVMIDDTVDGVFGHELARMVREDLKEEDTTIIVTTRKSADVALARESGADRCLEKPLNGNILLKSLLGAGKVDVPH